LSRWHQGKQSTNATKAKRQQLLSPQQEHELVLYIERCTRHGSPPIQEIIANFSLTAAKWKVSQSWVTGFLQRHKDELTIKWSRGIDRNRHEAENPFKYKLYLDMLHSKMREYDVEEHNTYNMDEKGFFVGITKATKRVFTKALWASKEATAAL
jgi:hypothetical protein